MLKRLYYWLFPSQKPIESREEAVRFMRDLVAKHVKEK